MSRMRPKQPRLRLDAASYRRLHRQVLLRDGYRCQMCGRLGELQVHHIKPRSKLGGDSEQNLIALCKVCHEAIHLVGRGSRQGSPQE
ncbi:MAG: HNH endonuclease [Acidobacteria bacterium]|nr:HNH endonuclease [Acidobacteriota bacterium]